MLFEKKTYIQPLHARGANQIKIYFLVAKHHSLFSLDNSLADAKLEAVPIHEP